METPIDFDPIVSAADRKTLAALRAELAKPDLTPERRSELIEFGHGIAEGYVAQRIASGPDA